MADQRVIIRLSRATGHIEGDCACSESGWLTSEVRWVGQECVVEQDCACPDTGLTTPLQSSPHAGLWQRPLDLYRAPLPEWHEVVFAPTSRSGIAVLNAPARRILDLFATPCHLGQGTDALPDLDPVVVSTIALELAQHGLLQPAGGAMIPCQAPPHTLTAWLHITNRCNLRCAYCYAAKGEEDMAEAIGREAVEAVFRAAMRHRFQAVKLKYAGGEPALNFSLVRGLHDQAQALARRCGLELREALLSNGVGLQDAVIVALREMGIRLAVSLDGIGKAHDVHRGAGSFVRVARSLDRAIALGLRPHISITVTAQSVEGLPDVVAYALDRGLAFNLNFYREYTCAAQQTDLRAANGCLVERVHAALCLIEERLPQQSIISGLLDRANLGYPHRYPCGVGQSYVVVDSQGRIARCHMEMERMVGSVREDDPVAAIRSSTNGWRNLDVDARRECCNCVWRYWCAGGCPLLTYRLAGREDVPSPYCEVYRAIFPELLRLEGLRLLRGNPPVT